MLEGDVFVQAVDGVLGDGVGGGKGEAFLGTGGANGNVIALRLFEFGEGIAAMMWLVLEHQMAFFWYVLTVRH